MSVDFSQVLAVYLFDIGLWRGVSSGQAPKMLVLKAYNALDAQWAHHVTC